jgi:hypothetical protein
MLSARTAPQQQSATGKGARETIVMQTGERRKLSGKRKVPQISPVRTFENKFQI